MNLAGRWTESLAGAGALLLAGGTLLCCALPILLVALGMGATVAAWVSAAPWLVTLSHFKAWLFAASGAALLGAAWFLHRPGRICPADARLARLCALADRWNRRVLALAGALWLLGAFAAYLLVPLRQWMDA